MEFWLICWWLNVVGWVNKSDVCDWLLAASSAGGRGPPPTPPPTYLWEEIRRSRSRGGYPWTILDKEPLDDDHYIDVDPFFQRYVFFYIHRRFLWNDVLIRQDSLEIRFNPSKNLRAWSELSKNPNVNLLQLISFLLYFSLWLDLDWIGFDWMDLTRL